LAHTRLDIRHKRPNIELVYDPAQKRLIEEIREIECEIQKLQERYDNLPSSCYLSPLFGCMI
jgi:hypothetical protein